MTTGQLNVRVVIESPPVTEDTTGGRYGAWTTYTTVWANFGTRRGGERYAGGGFEASATQAVTIRYKSGVTTAMRLNVGGRLYDISDVDHVSLRQRGFSVLQVREGVSHGN